MTVFFNGRLWKTPATMSVVDDSAMANKGLTVGNVIAMIGLSEGGKPNSILKFGSPAEARETLRSGKLLEAIEKAFDPSPQTNAASTVIGVRVNPATQSSLTIKDGAAANVITLKSTDYGLYTTQISFKIETGTNSGKKLTTSFGNDFFTEDDVTRDALSIQYTGPQATSIMTISNTTVTIEAPTGNNVATIDLNVYSTVRKLVDRINTVTDFTAIILGGNDEKPTLNGLDSIAAQDVKSAVYTVKADLQAVIDWINGVGEGFVDATRVAAAGTVPANLVTTFLAGGSDGTTTTTEWTNALTTLQSEDLQWVVPITSTASIHAATDAHAALMSNVMRMERRAFVGGAAAQTITQVIAAAKALNSDRTAQCYPGYWDFDSQGKLVLQPSYMTAALVAAAFAGANPGTAMTNKALKIRGVETKLRNPTDTDDLIDAGVLALEETNTGFKVVKSISTWLVNDNYNRVEVSTGFATDFVVRNVRQALDVLKGQKGSPLILARAVSITESVLIELARPEPSGPGVIVGDADNPAFKGVTADLQGDVVRVQFQASPVIPINFIPITVFAVPFQGTATT